MSEQDPLENFVRVLAEAQLKKKTAKYIKMKKDVLSGAGGYGAY